MNNADLIYLWRLSGEPDFVKWLEKQEELWSQNLLLED